MKTYLYKVISCFLLISITASSVLLASDDNAKDLLEGVMQARYQYTNFEAKVVVEQQLGQLWEMPAKMEYHIRVDDENGRSWLRRRPLVKIDMPANDMQLRGKRMMWTSSNSMHRERQWSLSFENRLSLSRNIYGEKHLCYSVHSLGLSVFPSSHWTSDSIEYNRGLVGLGIDNGQRRIRPDSAIVNDALCEAVDCVEPNGKVRTAWIERATLRLHKMEIPYPFFDFKLKEGEFGAILISSSFLPENETVIPDSVLIEESINGSATRKIKIALIDFNREKKFTDEDFSYSNMELRINSAVWDADNGTFLGYWNGRDWSSKKPIVGGNIVSAAIEASERPLQGTNVLNIVAVMSTVFAGVLFSVWLWRRSARPK
ncbi:MAG: hypothetical protein Q8M16_18050 [Pirellulaceae bacterium]|nr:hypothetical protein [Pirellulaceae bacterium]